MGYHRDPTADLAIGRINREFSRLEKKAERLLESFEEGKISGETLEKIAATQFRGLFKNVPFCVAAKKAAQKKEEE